MSYKTLIKAVLVMAFFSGCNTLKDAIKPSKSRCYELYPPVELVIDSNLLKDTVIITNPPVIEHEFVLVAGDTVYIDSTSGRGFITRGDSNKVYLYLEPKRDTITLKLIDLEKLQHMADSIYFDKVAIIEQEYMRKLDKAKNSGKAAKAQRNILVVLLSIFTVIVLVLRLRK